MSKEELNTQHTVEMHYVSDDNGKGTSGAGRNKKLIDDEMIVREKISDMNSIHVPCRDTCLPGCRIIAV